MAKRAASKKKAQVKVKSKLLDLPPGAVLSKAKRKKVAKLRKKTLSMCWCWYCEREFEDQKVLLAHQKAKHFRCPHCPRRLNTAGGLAVHIDQVHKLGTDRIANAIPGRDTFDVEIYGMEGVPASDLREWKRRKALEAGTSPEKVERKPRATIDKVVISRDDFARQIKAHKDLMEGKVAPSVAVNAFQGGALPFVPPTAIGPPPGVLPFAPPPGLPMPPPGLLLPPGIALPPLPGVPGLPGAPPLPGVPGLGVPPPPFALAPPPGAPAAQPKTESDDTVQTSSITLKPGQVLLYGDNEVSPEEKRAARSKYQVKPTPSDAPGPARAAASDFM